MVKHYTSPRNKTIISNILSLNQISQNLLVATAVLVPAILKHHCHCVTLLLQHLELSINGASGKEPTCQCRRFNRPGFSPWVGKIPWKRSWQPSPIFLPGESHGQRSLVGYNPSGHRVRYDWGDLAPHTLLLHFCGLSYLERFHLVPLISFNSLSHFMNKLCSHLSPSYSIHIFYFYSWSFQISSFLLSTQNLSIFRGVYLAVHLFHRAFCDSPKPIFPFSIPIVPIAGG